MTRRVYRVCRARYPRLDGEGARFAGGRWNSPGRAVVYMAESISLAVLENLVHMSRQDFPSKYVCVAILPAGMDIATGQGLRLRAELRRLSSQAFGDWWIQSTESAVLEVASAVCHMSTTTCSTRHIRTSQISRPTRRLSFISIPACFASLHSHSTTGQRISPPSRKTSSVTCLRFQAGTYRLIEMLRACSRVFATS